MLNLNAKRAKILRVEFEFILKDILSDKRGIFFENLKVGTLLAYKVIQSLKRLKRSFERIQDVKTSRTGFYKQEQ